MKTEVLHIYTLHRFMYPSAQGLLNPKMSLEFRYDCLLFIVYSLSWMEEEGDCRQCHGLKLLQNGYRNAFIFFSFYSKIVCFYLTFLSYNHL